MKLGPRRLSTLATRPETMFGSSPGMVSSVMSGMRSPIRPASVREWLAGSLPAAAEFVHLGQGIGIFGERDADVVSIVLLAAHGRAQNDGRALGVQRPFGVAIVGQRFGGDGHRPLLPCIHRRRHLGRHAKLAPVKFKAAHPAADFGVGLVWRSGIRIIIVLRPPAAGRHLANAVSFVREYCAKKPAHWAHLAERRPPRQWQLLVPHDRMVSLLPVGSAIAQRKASFRRSRAKSISAMRPSWAW